MNEQLSKAEFYRSLPTKRMASGVLFFDQEGQVLIVDPNYKESWEIPGGVVEKDESPLAAAVREVKEELGLWVAPESLKCVGVEYVPGDGDYTEGLMFVFSGGVLGPEARAKIKINEDELRSYRFVDPGQMATLLKPGVTARVLRGIDALERDSFSYFERLE